MIKKSLFQLNAAAITIFGLSTLIASPVIADNSYYEYKFLVTQDWHSCNHINNKYQEVYAFETPSFYINICRYADNYFYLGEAKNANVDSIFLPIKPIDRGKTYRADNGNMSYYVTINEIEPKAIAEAEGTITIERNGIQILTEKSLAQYCRMVDLPKGLNVRIKPDEQAQTVARIPFHDRVTLADLDSQGNPNLKQGLDDSLWVEISHPYKGFILFDSDKQPSLANCQ